MAFAHTKDVCDDVVGGVPLVPEGLKDLIGLVYPALHTVSQHLLDQEGVGLITHLQLNSNKEGVGLKQRH